MSFFVPPQSSLDGVEDAEEGLNGDVRVNLSQDNNKTPEAAEESRRNWMTMLAGLKRAVES